MISPKGELIRERLDKISNRVGVPVQIVADNSSDLASGIKLYQQKHPAIIYTHDVTQAMALILKYELEANDRYQSFREKCHRSKQQLKQTELAFLSPPAQRSQCRYLNIEKLISWGNKLLNSSPSTLAKLVPNLTSVELERKIAEKLGWLFDYQVELGKWQQMVKLTRQVETQLKPWGIERQSLEYCQQTALANLPDSLGNFPQRVAD
ncbi:MAG: hypothetical protein KME17_03195 [Cyanosarcina radialis HA8281-LM2]|jgi:hypothetical protein|nr:hypothetical protein [Cyanosarcina radialis HA8281-LM2]